MRQAYRGLNPTLRLLVAVPGYSTAAYKGIRSGTSRGSRRKLIAYSVFKDYPR